MVSKSNPIAAVAGVAVGVFAGLGIAVAVVVGLGLRFRWPPVLDGLRRFSRDRINPGQLATAGQPGAYAAAIEHRGRVTGTPYRTPVVVRVVPAGFVVSLTYGTRADWVRNVLAAGSTVLVHEGVTHDGLVPEVVAIDRSGPWLRAGERRLLGWFGIESVLVLRPQLLD